MNHVLRTTKPDLEFQSTLLRDPRNHFSMRERLDVLWLSHVSNFHPRPSKPSRRDVYTRLVDRDSFAFV
jgi:hypothetical protein